MADMNRTMTCDDCPVCQYNNMHLLPIKRKSFPPHEKNRGRQVISEGVRKDRAI